MAAAAASQSFVTAAHLGRIRAPLEEDDMDVDVVLEQKGNGKQTEMKRKQVDEEEEVERLPQPKKRTNEAVEIVEDSLPRTKKRKEWTNDQVREVVEDTMLRTKKIMPRKENLVVVAKIWN